MQWQLVNSLPGLKDAVITRPAYAVEYDYFPAVQCKHNLESKNRKFIYCRSSAWYKWL